VIPETFGRVPTEDQPMDHPEDQEMVQDDQVDLEEPLNPSK
jgi:hypothetical protein